MNRPMYLLWVGCLIGTAIAIATSSAIALSMFATDCPWAILWMTWGKLLVLTIPTFSATTTTALLLKYAIPRGENGDISLPAMGVTEGESTEPSAGPSLAEEIVGAAYEQAEHYYLNGEKPTRRLFEQMGMRQSIWSSAHDLLSVAGIVEGNTWTDRTWTEIKAALDKMYPDHDRIWVRPLGSRDMLSISVSQQLAGNKYTMIEE